MRGSCANGWRSTSQTREARNRCGSIFRWAATFRCSFLRLRMGKKAQPGYRCPTAQPSASPAPRQPAVAPAAAPARRSRGTRCASGASSGDLQRGACRRDVVRDHSRERSAPTLPPRGARACFVGGALRRAGKLLYCAVGCRIQSARRPFAPARAAGGIYCGQLSKICRSAALMRTAPRICARSS